MAQASRNAIYIGNTDINEVLQRHIGNFDWRGQQCVLDVDCGYGEVTQDILLPLLPPEATLIGWDESKEKIDHCNKVRKVPRLSFHNVDVQYVDLFFNWKWEHFHKIFSFHSIHWMQNLRRSLSNMHSLLKNNGDLLLVFLTQDNPMYRAFEMLKQRALYERLFSNITWFFTTTDPMMFIRKLLDEIGFVHVFCWQKTSSINYPSWDAYMDLIDSVNPYLPGLAPHQISECRMSIRDFMKYDNQISEDDLTGEITVNYGIVVAVAKKPNKKQEKK